MKLPNAVNKIFLATIFSLLLMLSLSCSALKITKHTAAQIDAQIPGTWKYISISKNDSALFGVGSTDTMILRPDHSFRYDIESANKHSYGKWSITESGGVNFLELTYAPADNIRRFEIIEYSQISLAIREGLVVFAYRKKLL